MEHLRETNSNLGVLNTEYFQSDIAVLQAIIDKNEILADRHPLSIGRQKWEQMRLVSLDLSDMNVTDLPISLCSLTPQLRKLDLSGNSICPPYPYCIDYISNQDITGCGKYSCPDGYVEIDDACYMGSHIDLSLIHI